MLIALDKLRFSRQRSTVQLAPLGESWQLNSPATLQLKSQANAELGFTLLELLVVMAIAGILAAIAAPSWSAFVEAQRLGTAQDRAFQVMREAQAKARQQRRVWETCFRDAGQVEYSVHPFDLKANCQNASWRPLIDGVSGSNQVTIDTTNTTLFKAGVAYRAQFTSQGWTSGQLGRVSFMLRDRPTGGRSCVFLSTLLGAMRADRDQSCLR